MQEQTQAVTTSRFNEPIEYQGLSWWKTLIVLSILLALGFGAYRYIVDGKPQARVSAPPPSLVSVEAAPINFTDYPIKVSTNGTVTAATRSTLVAQVSGEITQVSPSFASGGQFKKGDVLLEIDSRNYASAVSNSSADFSQAQANLEQEQAEAEQALKEWQRLGFDETPSDLVLRKPQLAAAEAAVESAKAALDRARLDLARTKVRAPFDGSIIDINADIGQFVPVGTALGEIFSDEGLEIELPLNQEQYSQLLVEKNPAVLLSANISGEEHQWQANVIRADSVFDTTTRQLNVIAKIDNPLSDKNLRLKIGQYVSAVIDGQIIKNAAVVANQSIREGSFVYLYDQGVLRKRDITITWQDDENAIVTGISPSELVVLTSLGGIANGASARLIGDRGKRLATTDNPPSTVKNLPLDKQTTAEQGAQVSASQREE